MSKAPLPVIEVLFRPRRPTLAIARTPQILSFPPGPHRRAASNGSPTSSRPNDARNQWNQRRKATHEQGPVQPAPKVKMRHDPRLMRSSQRTNATLRKIHGDSKIDSGVAGATLRERTIEKPERDRLSDEPADHVLIRHVSNDAAAEKPQRPERYAKASYHTSVAPASDPVRYVVTLSMTPLLQRTLNDMRKQHWPRHLNNKPAHVCLVRSLPGSSLFAVVSDIKEVVSSTGSFRLVAAAEASRTARGVHLTFSKGGDAVARLRDTLLQRWRGMLPQRRIDANVDVAAEELTRQAAMVPPSEPHVQLLGRVEDQRLIDEALRQVDARLRELTAGGRGPAGIAAPLDAGGGTLAGVATGLTVSRWRKGGRWEFVRRFNFRDVPSRGWARPELVTIPVLEGGDEDGGGRSGMFEMPASERSRELWRVRQRRQRLEEEEGDVAFRTLQLSVLTEGDSK